MRKPLCCNLKRLIFRSIPRQSLGTEKLESFIKTGKISFLCSGLFSNKIKESSFYKSFQISGKIIGGFTGFLWGIQLANEVIRDNIPDTPSTNTRIGVNLLVVPVSVRILSWIGFYTPIIFFSIIIGLWILEKEGVREYFIFSEET